MYALAAITAILSLASAAPTEKRAPAKTTYTGNGSAAAGWPTKDKWATFDSLWSANVANIKGSCAAFGVPNNSDAEVAGIKTAIGVVSKNTGVDNRFILAVLLQESHACVRVHKTVSPDGTVVNPGMMQDHDGTHFCNAGTSGAPKNLQNPCPQPQIEGMIQDGTGGTAKGDGLKQTIAKAGGSDAQTIYKAARIYNSGSLSANGDLGSGGATSSYSSDIANRLVGVVF